MKIVPSVELIGPRLTDFATACGGALARAHARSGDPMTIASYIGKGGQFAEAIGEFARRYAGQTERDHAELADAVTSGKITSEPA